MQKMTEQYSKVKVPAGTYYIGDLCYVINDDVWDEVCNAMFPDGIHPKDGLIEVRGHQMISFSTMWGDGMYYGHGYEFPVDAGLIGLISMDSLDENALGGKRDNEAEIADFGAIVEFKEDFECYSDNGYLVFGHIGIDTAGGEEEEDEYDYDEE